MSLLGFIFNRLFKASINASKCNEADFPFYLYLGESNERMWQNDMHGQGAEGQKGHCFCSSTEERWIILLRGV